MKSPRQAIFILSFLVAATVSAQQLEIVEKGEPVDNYDFKKENKIDPDVLFNFVNTGAKKNYTIYGVAHKKALVGVWNDYCTLAEVKSVNGLGAPGTTTTIGFQLYASIEGKNFVFFTSEIPNDDSDNVDLYAMQLDDDLNPLGSPIVLERYSNVRKYGRNFNVVPSDDNKHFLIVRTYKRKNINDPQKIECKVINSDFSEVWKKEFPFENDYKDVELRSARLDNRGNMLLVVAYATNNPLNGNKVKYTALVYTYFHKTGNFKMMDIGLKDGDNVGVRLHVKSPTVFVAGLNKQGKTIRYFVHKLDVETESLEMVSSNPMPENFYKNANWRLDEFRFWGVGEIIPFDNGTTVVAVESAFELANARSGAVGFQSFDAFLMAFSENGDHKWAHVIRKYQRFPTSPKVGVRYIPAGNKLFAVYNDAVANLKLELDKTAWPVNPAFPIGITVQEIDESGNAKRYALTNDKELENGTLDTSTIQKLDDTAWLSKFDVVNKKGNQHRYLILKVK
jgi:hypothetical protein